MPFPRLRLLEKMRCPSCLNFGLPVLVFFDFALHHTTQFFSSCMLCSHFVFSSSVKLSQRMSFGPVCGPQKGIPGRPALAKQGAAETADSPTSISALLVCCKAFRTRHVRDLYLPASVLFW